MIATAAVLSDRLDLSPEVSEPVDGPSGLRLVSVLVVLAGFMFNGAVLALLTPPAGVLAGVVSALFTGVLVSGATRDARYGIFFGSLQVVFAGFIISFGDALSAVVPGV